MLAWMTRGRRRDHPIIRELLRQGRTIRWLAQKFGRPGYWLTKVLQGDAPEPPHFWERCAAFLGTTESAIRPEEISTESSPAEPLSLTASQRAA